MLSFTLIAFVVSIKATPKDTIGQQERSSSTDSVRSRNMPMITLDIEMNSDGLENRAGKFFVDK